MNYSQNEEQPFVLNKEIFNLDKIKNKIKQLMYE